MSSNVFTNWLNIFAWWYTGFPAEILRNQKLAFLAIASFFSFPILLKTLFQPWKKDVKSYSRKTIPERVEILGMNFISRFVGLVIRSVAMGLGIIILILLVIFYVLLWIAWVVAPVSGVILIFLAIREIAGGQL